MIDHMREPSGGQDVSATQNREIIRAVRANRLIAGPNVGLKWTPNGTVVSASAPSRQRRNPDRTRYAIKSITETTPGSSSSTLTVTLKNLYYDIRCQTYVATDEDVEINKSGAAFVALQISKSGWLPDATLVKYTSFEAMQQAQKDFSKAVIPLYKFTDGALECDFRTGPSVQAWEFSA